MIKKKTLAFGPTKPLKVFNWAKLPDAKAANCIWKDIDEIDVSILKLSYSDILRVFDIWFISTYHSVTFINHGYSQMVTMLNLDEIDELFQSKKSVKVSF